LNEIERDAELHGYLSFKAAGKAGARLRQSLNLTQFLFV
jgi:hypothetical protein